MRAIAAFLAVTGIFVAINLVAAGVLFALFKGIQAVGLEQFTAVRLVVGIAGIAFSIWVCAAAYRFIDRQLAQRRARARA